MDDAQKDALVIAQSPIDLTISVKRDGVWLNFRASTGKQASLRVESLGEERRGIIGRALLDWCADRRKDASAQQTQISEEVMREAAMQELAKESQAIGGYGANDDEDGALARAKPYAVIARMREAMVEAEKALEPFAKHREFIDREFPEDGDDTICAGLQENPITMGHFRAAFAALAKLRSAMK